MLEPSRIREVLDYNSETGELTWINCSKFHREKNGQRAGAIMPGRGKKSYRKITIDGRKYSASRVAFAWMTGRWPRNLIDHVNGDSLDDRWSNLREATFSENCWNRKGTRKESLLPMGVRAAQSGKFLARISQNRRQYTIGTFDTPEQAFAAYIQERKARYGRFA